MTPHACVVDGCDEQAELSVDASVLVDHDEIGVVLWMCEGHLKRLQRGLLDGLRPGPASRPTV